MTIDYAIHSSDSNPMYLDFWAVTSKIWKLKFGITPILIYIDENTDIEIDQTYGMVVKIKPIKGIPIYLQNLWVRYFYPTMMPEKVSIISDIDMLPISKKYFVEQIKDISEDSYIHLNPCTDTYHNLYPSCYHIAKGKTFKDVIVKKNTWEESINEIYSLNLGTLNGDKAQWFADERFATQRINEYPNKEVFKFLPRLMGQNGYRIDRSLWEYDASKMNEYIDCHSVRPYAEHKNEINKLVNLILE